MIKLLYIFLQFIILFIIVSWAIHNSKQVSFIFSDVTVTTSTSVLIIGVLIIIITSLFLQRFIFFIKQSKQKYKFYRELANYEKGHNSFIKGMVALVNKDFKGI